MKGANVRALDVTTAALATRRLTLRPWSSSDLTAFHDVFGDPRVIYWGSFSRSLEESTRRLERALAEQDLPRPGLGRFAVALRSTGAVIGNVNLRPANFAEGIELGYHFAHAAWGHGYATEAARAILDYG